MPFDDKTRNRLARFVTDARELIKSEFTEQLQRVYGISATGDITALADLRDLDEEQHALAELLRERVDYLKASSLTEENPTAAAVDRLAREQAFTVLNRLAAIRMAEKRAFIVESVGHGYQSKGFQVYCQVAGSGLGDVYHRYRRYLFCMFDELAWDLGALFDRRSPTSLLFPRESALLKLFELINAPDIDALWTDDETIGWIYQYFNSKEERQKMREESAAPRNTRELAVRNQFFTPRYVVEFLVDNTLGRIWYEMRAGDTCLAEKCRYLVRQPLEIFLGDPIQAYERLYGKQDDCFEIPEPVTAAYRGDLSKIEGDRGPHERWIAIAIPPDQFLKITGQKYDPAGGSEVLDRIWEAIERKPESPILSDVLSIWTGLSEFVRASSGSPYDREPFEKLWNAFKNAIRNQASKEQSQAEILKNPVYISYRAKKDPRDLKILDPAVGSGHFLLYAFDLLQLIYEEAWSDDKSPVFSGTNRTLRDECPDIDTLRRRLPELIVRHNLHGIDIDLRACQIAALALWLRTQRAWHEQGLKLVERPQIRRSNIVCAEPMPGELEMLDEFVSELQPKVVGQLVRRVFEAMKLAGEAGSLLKIEDEIVGAVAEAKKQWLKSPKPEQIRLFGDSRPIQEEFGFDLAGITDETFWEEAEGRIYAALQVYSEQAENGTGFWRRLFAEDAASGFAFVDLCRKHYDTILMNPPFGEVTTASKNYLGRVFSGTKYDLFAMFVARWLERLEFAGGLGAITNKTGFFLQTFETWRDLISTQGNALTTAMDLGFGVLDTAMVETMAYTIRKSSPSLTGRTVFIRLTHEPEKQSILERTIANLRDGTRPEVLWLKGVWEFDSIPHKPMCYWAGPEFVGLFTSHESFAPNNGHIYQGIATGDNFRFLRTRWEVSPRSLKSDEWVTYAKGGASTLWVSDFSLIVLWSKNGREIKANAQQCYGSASRTVKNEDVFFKPGLTYTQVTVKGFFARALPEGAVFDMKGPLVLVKTGGLYRALGIFSSLPIRALAKLLTDCRQWHPTNLMRLPYPNKLEEEPAASLELAARRLVSIRQQPLRYDEVSSLFCSPSINHCVLENENQFANVVDSVVAEGFGVNLADFRELDLLLQAQVADIDEDAESEDSINSKADLVLYAVGCSFGRWDIRFTTGEKSAPELPDPFAALPVCSPGMLQNEEDLPLTQDDVRRLLSAGKWNYPLEIPWGGVLVDDPGHSLDIEVRVRQVLGIIWTARAEAIEQETCEILGYKSLREYFRKPSGFFDDHLKRYSRSRRQAPIYWPLSTRSGSYTLWLYYPRLSSQTLHTCLADFLDPKLKNVSDQIRAARQLKDSETRIGELLEFEDELKEMRTEVDRLIKLPYEPNLNDGVLITASPLWKLFRLPKWQKDLKVCWQELERGDFDWAHLAYSMWPDRVKEKCRLDRSIAITHGLEHLCSIEGPKPKTKRNRKKEATLIEEDTL